MRLPIKLRLSQDSSTIHNGFMKRLKDYGSMLKPAKCRTAHSIPSSMHCAFSDFRMSAAILMFLSGTYVYYFSRKILENGIVCFVSYFFIQRRLLNNIDGFNFLEDRWKQVYNL